MEYMIIVSLSERSTIRFVHSKSEFEKNAYKNLLLCYYLGMFVGRSSLICVKLRNALITLLTVLQSINVMLFWTIAKNEWMGIPQMMGVMFWVGFLGGASYANCFYKIIESKKLEKKFRELAINFSGLLVETGIFFACVIGLILANTVLKK